MEVVKDRRSFREACQLARADGKEVGFVPTMGFLHEGHLSLVARARQDTAFVPVSIFVNPLQFGPSEDLASYPRDLDRDVELCEKEGADLVFAPEPDEMYPARPEVTIDPGPLGERLEGASRPGHFRGVCTVVAKLFGLAGPCRSYFGEKDAQQLAVIRRMVADLELPVEVVACPTVREPDGLAMSSRNTYLSGEERRAATCLYEALARAAWLVEGGERDVLTLKAEMAKRIGAEALARVDYVAVVDEETFQEVDVVRGPARALVAARIGTTRLIDNLALKGD
ncbi:MAG TPA: pantoate--beta-alanine ligase [Actinomycetota bacterium]|nr:pantoate--beta-alanine ligase [Actinomycetota bacterium]